MTIAEYKQIILDAKDNQAALDALNSTSDVSVYQQWAFVTAVGELIVDQNMAEIKDYVDGVVKKNYKTTLDWLRSTILRFQYSDTDIQAVELGADGWAYPVENAALRVITRCSCVSDTSNKAIFAKVATGGDTPAVASTNILTALSAYLNAVQTAGPPIILVSRNADLLYIEADVKVDGQFISSYKSEAQANFTTYIKNLSGIDLFGSVVNVADIADVFQKTRGYKNLRIKEIALRRADQAFADRTIIYLNKDNEEAIDLVELLPYAGYVVLETETDQDFNRKVTISAY
jgi:hypothetical protein